MNFESIDLMSKVFHVLDDKLALQLEAMKVGEVSIIADYFVIATGRTTAHTKALYEYVDEAVKNEYGIDPIRVEGADASRWIVMDYGSVIVHIFCQEDREFYGLDKLWAEAPKVEPKSK